MTSETPLHPETVIFSLLFNNNMDETSFATWLRGVYGISHIIVSANSSPPDMPEQAYIPDNISLIIAPPGINGRLFIHLLRLDHQPFSIELKEPMTSTVEDLHQFIFNALPLEP